MHFKDESLERGFARAFAVRQQRLDVAGTLLGSVIYLSLLRPLWAIGRGDLMVAVLACALASPWPILLTRSERGRAVYLRHRDALFMAHLFFHHAVGGQLARFVRLTGKFPDLRSDAVFMAAHLLSSTVAWQCVNSLVYRVRLRAFLLGQPLALLASLPLEAGLCRDSCAAHPVESKASATVAFVRLLEVVRLAMSLPLALPQHAAVNAAPASPLASCIKLQTFLLAALGYVVPAAVMYVLEQDSRRKFLRQRQQDGSGGGGGAAARGQAEAWGALVAGPPSRLVAAAPSEQEQGRIQRFGALLLLLFAVPFTFHCIDTVM